MALGCKNNENTKTISRGKNFGISFLSEKVPIKHLIAEFKSNIQKNKEEYRNEAKLKYVNCIESFSNKKQSSLNTFQKQVIELFKSTNTFLKNNPHILITKADKDNITVAMDRNKYIFEATLILSDKKTYELLKKDPTNITHKKVNNFMNL